PLLARWRVGTGTSVAWTSDIKNRWAVDWLSWPNYGKFWAQIIRTSMRQKIHTSYDLRAEVQDGKANVTVDAIDLEDKFVNELDTELQIIDPRDSKVKQTVPMTQTAAGRYTGEFDIERYGTFILKAVHRRNGEIAAESTG